MSQADYVLSFPSVTVEANPSPKGSHGSIRAVDFPALALCLQLFVGRRKPWLEVVIFQSVLEVQGTYLLGFIVSVFLTLLSKPYRGRDHRRSDSTFSNIPLGLCR